jgi:hypothetical protein
MVMSGDYIIKLLSLKSVAIGNKKYTNFITKTAVDADLDNFVRREKDQFFGNNANI